MPLENIKYNILHTFTKLGKFDVEKINIQVIGNAVVLTGRVNTFSEKQEAEIIVLTTPGVMRIDSRLKIDSRVN